MQGVISLMARSSIGFSSKAFSSKDVRAWWQRLTKTDSEQGAEDVIADLASLRFLLFYTVPKVKFTLHFASHLAYALYFSIFLLVDTPGVLVPSVTRHEVLVWAWSCTRFVGEVSEIETWDYKGLKIYFRDAWNVQDQIFFGLTVATAALRITANSDEPSVLGARIEATPEYAHLLDATPMYKLWPRTLYAMMIILLYVRVLQYLRYYRELGVLTIVIGHMMRDIVNFLIVLLCFSVGFGFAFVVLMPGETHDHPPLPEFLGESPIWYSMWGIFGMIALGSNTLDGMSTVQPTMWAVPLFMWLYLFITIVVLVNLLIAQMSDTYSRVTSEGLLRWQFERAQLIDEFKDSKKPVPPPFNVLWFALVTLPNKLRVQYRRVVWNEREVDAGGFKLLPSMRRLNEYRGQERDALKRCLQTRERRDEETNNARIKRLQASMTKLDVQGRANFEALNGRVDELKAELRGDELKAELRASLEHGLEKLMEAVAVKRS
jgi:hypothetical protein